MYTYSYALHKVENSYASGGNRNKQQANMPLTHQSNQELVLGRKGVINVKDTCYGESVSEVSHPAFTNLTGDLGMGAAIGGGVDTGRLG